MEQECESCGRVSEDVVLRDCGCILCRHCYINEDHPNGCRDYEQDVEEDAGRRF